LNHWRLRIQSRCTPIRMPNGVRWRDDASMKTRVLFAAIAALSMVACQRDASTRSASPASPRPTGMAWVSQGDDWTEKKATLQALGEQFDTSWALYQKLRADAHGGTPLTWSQLALPEYDWSGIYTRTKGGLQFDPDLRMDQGPVSAKLTPEGQ